jgi:tetratricopeptide (TPR) repeat protein
MDYAFVCFKLGCPDQAISDYTKAIRLKPDSMLAYVGRGLVYYKLKRYADALEDLIYAIWLRPKYPELYRIRAKIYDAIGDHVPAESDRKKAKELMTRSRN